MVHRGGAPRDAGSILGRRLKGKGRQRLYGVNVIRGVDLLTVV